MNSGTVFVSFDMGDPDQRHQHDLMMKADSMRIALDDLYQYLRAERKYNPPNEMIEIVWKKYFEVLADNGLGIDD